MKYALVNLIFLCGCVSTVEKVRISEFQELDSPISTSQLQNESSNVREIDITFQELTPLEKTFELYFPSTKAYYTVQIGAYPTRKMAQVHASSLNLVSSLISYEKAEIKGKTWQRVLVGKFKNKKSALDFQKKLPGKSFVRVVQTTE